MASPPDSIECELELEQDFAFLETASPLLAATNTMFIYSASDARLHFHVVRILGPLMLSASGTNKCDVVSIQYLFPNVSDGWSQAHCLLLAVILWSFCEVCSEGVARHFCSFSDPLHRLQFKGYGWRGLDARSHSVYGLHVPHGVVQDL